MGWTLNDYQINVATPGGQAEYKRVMDTTSTLYAGISAEKSDKRDSALIYYKIIADSGITKIGGNDMAEIYKWLSHYYTRKGDRRMRPSILHWVNQNIQMIFFMMNCS